MPNDRVANDPVVIASFARTPMGSMLGQFADLSAANLGAVAIRAAVERAGLDAAQVEQVIMGNVLGAGQGQAPARQAAFGGGLSDATGCNTINKMCGSGMQAVIFAHDQLLAGSANIMLAGGMESMTNAPYLVQKARAGYRIGHGTMHDHMMLDGLEDAYEAGTPMGEYAERTVSELKLDRKAQDDFAIESLRRALAANEDGSFDAEIAPVTVKNRKGEQTYNKDEQPYRGNAEKIPQLRPAFRKDGTVTAANASSISDGAAAVVLCRESTAKAQGLKPVARIVAHASHAQAPAKFCTAPVHAIDKLLQKTSWKTSDVGLWEINEAFAVVSLAAMQQHQLSHDVVNVFGGACALGHPIGASGTRILVTLLNAMQQRNVQTGVASLCIGGGEATALAVELI